MKKIKFIRRFLIDNEFVITEVTDEARSVQVQVNKNGIGFETNFHPTRKAAYTSLMDNIVYLYYKNTDDYSKHLDILKSTSI